MKISSHRTARLVIAVSLVGAGLLEAAKKPAIADYQEAVLLDLQTRESGMHCSASGTVRGQEDDSGYISGTASTSSHCVPVRTTYYRISAGEHTYTLRPAVTGKQVGLAAATLGYSRLLAKDSVLARQLPGSKILVRSDEHGFWVKLGKRESKFEVVEAR